MAGNRREGAEGAASPALLSTLIHRSDQLSTGQGVGLRSASGERAPGHCEFSTGMYCVPSQKIFAKVKAITPLTCGYIYCDTTHILKTRNALNFLPYI